MPSDTTQTRQALRRDNLSWSTIVCFSFPSGRGTGRWKRGRGIGAWFTRAAFHGAEMTHASRIAPVQITSTRQWTLRRCSHRTRNALRPCQFDTQYIRRNESHSTRQCALNCWRSRCWQKQERYARLRYPAPDAASILFWRARVQCERGLQHAACSGPRG